MQNDKERLAKWMEANGYTVRSLAEKTGDTVSSIHQMVKGDRAINSAFKWRFKQAFGNEIADSVFCEPIEREPA